MDLHDDDVIPESPTSSSSPLSNFRSKCVKTECQNVVRKYETLKSTLGTLTNEIEQDILAFERCTRSGHPDPVEVKRLTDNIRNTIRRTENSQNCDAGPSQEAEECYKSKKRRFDSGGHKLVRNLTDPPHDDPQRDETRVTSIDDPDHGDMDTFSNESHSSTWRRFAIEVINLEPILEAEIPATNNITSFGEDVQPEQLHLDSSIDTENSTNDHDASSSSLLENSSKSNSQFSENLTATSSSGDDDGQKSGQNSLETSLERMVEVDLVIQEILLFLDFNALKICRLLSTTWLQRATTEIRKRSVISFRFDQWSSQYLQERRWLPNGCERKRKTLFDLNRRVSKSQKFFKQNFNFPVEDFRFCQGDFSLHGDNHNACNDLLTFFEVCGPFVKHLSLLLSYLDKDTFRRFLVHAAPNLTSVSLLLFSNIDFDMGDPDDNFELPNLKILHGDKAFSMLSGKAPNLTHALNIIFEFLPAPFLDGQNLSKIRAIKEIFCNVEPTSLDKLAKFAQAQPRLTSFYFGSQSSNFGGGGGTTSVHEDWPQRMAEEFEKIMKSSQDCLRILKIGFIPKVVDFLRIPRLKNVHRLCLRSYAPARIFPALINLSATFPNLRRLDIGLGSDKDANWDANFPPMDAFDFTTAGTGAILSTVMRLTIRGSCTTLWLQRLRELVPNVEILELSHGYQAINRMLRDIWRIWRNLTELTIKCGYFENGVHNFDSAFTGLPENICKKLRVQQAVRHELVMDKLRQTNPPSIRGLKGLKRLNIMIRTSWIHLMMDPGRKKWSLISILSALYGFSLMPKLKVTIFYNHFKEDSAFIAHDLSPLMPYVDMVHWSNSKTKESFEIFST